MRLWHYNLFPRLFPVFQFLAWTEEELGEELTDENKAVLADRLKEVAKEQEGEEESSSWFFDME